MGPSNYYSKHSKHLENDRHYIGSLTKVALTRLLPTSSAVVVPFQ